MPEQPWFKHWAKDSLMSLDLLALSDHEERVWWRLLALASLQEPRGTFPIDGKALAFMCASTAPKVLAAVRRFASLGMVTVTDGTGEVANWGQYQGTPPNANATRQKRYRDRHRNGGETLRVTPALRDSNAQEGRGESQSTDPPPIGGGGARNAPEPPPPVSELLSQLRLQIGEPKWRQDPSIEAQYVALIAVHGEEAVGMAVTECHRHRENGRTLTPWPNNLRRFLPGEEVERGATERGPSAAHLAIEAELRAAGRL